MAVQPRGLGIKASIYFIEALIHVREQAIEVPLQTLFHIDDQPPNVVHTTLSVIRRAYAKAKSRER